MFTTQQTQCRVNRMRTSLMVTLVAGFSVWLTATPWWQARGQAVNDVRPFTATTPPHAETAIAVDPTNPAVMLAAGMHNGRGIIVAWTHDGGTTWELYGLNGIVTGAGADPAAGIRGRDGLWIVTFIPDSGADVSCILSSDHGNTWSPIKPVVAIADNIEDLPQLAIDNDPASPGYGDMYVGWGSARMRPEGGYDDPRIGVIRSPYDPQAPYGGGAIWADAVFELGRNLLDGVNYETTHAPSLAVGPNGEVYVAFDLFPEDINALKNPTALGVTVGVPESGTIRWEAAQVAVSGFTGPWKSDVPLNEVADWGVAICYPVLTVDHSVGAQRGTVYVTWVAREAMNGFDVRMAWASPAPGALPVFGNAVSVGGSRAEDQFTQWATCDPLTGSIGVLYFDRGADSLNLSAQLTLSLSSDRGVSWRNVTVSDPGVSFSDDPPRIPEHGREYIGLAASGGAFACLWADRRTGPWDIYFSGDPWRLLSPSDGEIVAEGDLMQVTWAGAGSGAEHVDVLLSRNDGVEYDTTLATAVPNTGSCWWAVDGAHVARAARLKLVFRASDGSVVAEAPSDAAFTVVGSGRYVNLSGETGLDYEGTPYSVIAFDYNGPNGSGDGYLDLMITQFDEPGELYARTGISEHLAPVFTPKTIDAFPSNAPQAGLRGLAFDSFNDDARPDVFAADATNPRLYRNDGPVGGGGEVIFTDVADEVGLDESATNSWAGAWGHIDNDGRVDLLVARAGVDPPPPPPNIEHPKEDLGRQATALLRNVLDSTDNVVFQNVTGAAGLTWQGDGGVVGIAALWADVDDDGDQDIFVGDRANEPSGDSRLFLSDGDGTFTRVSQGPDGLGSVTSAVWADVDGDLVPDLAVTQEPLTSTTQPLVCYNQSGTLAAPVSLPSQLTAASGVAVLDENVDLVPDVLVTPIDPDESPQLLYGVKMPSGAHSFLDGTVRTGLDDSRGTVHGLIVAQFDPDARPDIYLGRTVASDAIYYRSQARPGSAKLSGAGVQLVGGLGGNDLGAVGARVVLKQDGQPVALQVVDGGSGRGSQGSPQLTFATPDTMAGYSVEITWLEGYIQTAVVEIDALTVIPDQTDPTIHPTSMAASYQPDVGGLATWTFEFDTDSLPKADGDEIVVSSTAGCLSDLITLRGSQPNVTVTIAAKAGGGWHHTVVALGMTCIPNCVYTWYCKSSTAHMTSTTQASPKTFKTKVCAQ